ncbi:hypothetical protein GCM10027341_38790 [Spirosoma knui]
MPIAIEIENPFKEFDNHLSISGNKRILLFAPFGYGKTYFLDKYFRDKKRYNAIWLSPIKYVVGQNEDIFEYIKMDLAMELLSTDDLVDVSVKNFTTDLYLNQYLRNHPAEVGRLLIESLKDTEVPVVKSVASIIHGSIKVYDAFKKWKEDLTEGAKTDYEKLINYSLSQTEIKGSIYEDDLTTQSIRYLLQKRKKISKK